MLVLQIYVLWQPIMIWLFAGTSKNFTWDQYLSSIVLRWQLGTFSAIAILISGDLITYIPNIYAVYQSSQQNNTLTDSDWENYFAYTLTAWAF